MQPYAAAFLIALLASYILTPMAIKLAVRVGAMDAPDARKVHREPIPRMGGLAIYVAFVVAVLATAPYNQQVMGILIGSTVIVAVGILDDLYQLAAKVKLAGQIVAAAVLLFFDIRIDWVMNPFGGEMIYFDWLAIPITIFWIVGLTNTVNLIDGLDGLAAGVSTIAAVSILFIAADMGIVVVALLLAALAGGAVGFLKYNMNPAKVFMGDTGSMFLGYVLAAVAIVGAVKSAATIALIVPIVALGLPILDTAFAILRRKLSGEPIFKPDKGHLHHRLLAMGLSQKQAVWLMYGISCCLGISAFILTEVSVLVGCGIVAGLLILAVFGARKIGVLKADRRQSAQS